MEENYKYIIDKFFKQQPWKKLYYDIFPDKYVNSYLIIKSVHFELSSKCNLKCPFCTQRFDKKTGVHMGYEKAVEYFNKLPKTVRCARLHFSGEPFLNPDISKITGFLSGKGVFTTASTNGTLSATRYIETLDCGLNELIFAIDGATPETHEKYRKGSSFEKIIKTLSEVLEKKPEKASVGVQCLVTRFNENEIEKMIEIMKGIRADFLNLKPLSLNIGSNDSLESKNEKLRNAEEFLPKNDKYLRYYYKNNQLKLKYPRLLCPFIYEPAIGADGEICLCTEDIDRLIKIGNLNDYTSFDELWKTKKYQGLRKDVLKKKLSICKNCNYNIFVMERVNLK